MVSGTEAGGSAVGLEPLAIGVLEDARGTFVGCGVGNVSGVMSEVVGRGPGWGFGVGKEGVGRVEEAVKEMANAAEVVNGEGEEEDAFGVKFGDDVEVGTGEFGSSAGVVCLGEVNRC